ncbi:MAG: hypothetical protein JSV39_00760 [Candidatus Aenigmatarchaeota archaeon]|nr:MAG: hypothetical protein JSV39_00760 [Candidatus Aenigmarchaeota archaeon]
MGKKKFTYREVFSYTNELLESLKEKKKDKIFEKPRDWQDMLEKPPVNNVYAISALGEKGEKSLLTIRNALRGIENARTKIQSPEHLVEEGVPYYLAKMFFSDMTKDHEPNQITVKNGLEFIREMQNMYEMYGIIDGEDMTLIDFTNEGLINTEVKEVVEALEIKEQLGERIQIKSSAVLVPTEYRDRFREEFESSSEYKEIIERIPLHRRERGIDNLQDFQGEEFYYYDLCTGDEGKPYLGVKFAQKVDPKQSIMVLKEYLDGDKDKYFYTYLTAMIQAVIPSKKIHGIKIGEKIIYTSPIINDFFSSIGVDDVNQFMTNLRAKNKGQDYFAKLDELGKGISSHIQGKHWTLLEAEELENIK